MRSQPVTPRHDDERALDVMRLRAAAGLPPGDGGVLPPRARRAVSIAEQAGSPLLDALDGAAAAEDDLRETRRAVQVASAQTRVVGAGLVAAPFVLLPLLGRLVGHDLLAFYGTPAGRLVGLCGLALLLAGAATVLLLVRRVGTSPATLGPRKRALVAAMVGLFGAVVAHPLVGIVIGGVVLCRRRRAHPPAPAGLDEAADLVATALGGGCAPGHALRLAAQRVAGTEAASLAPDLRSLALELELGLVTDPHARIGRLAAVLVAATDVGAPAAPALRRLATDLRADERARVLAAAERLPAQLTFPTALALLPATLLLVGAPIVQVGLRHAVS